MLIALTRPVPPSIARCELTHLAREPIDVARATAEHEAYERALTRLGCTVKRLPATPDFPDSVFVEDTAVVLDELAIITRPGAASRRAETESVATALSEYRQLARIDAPATLDGGDVLPLGRRIFVGLSSRTNAAAVDQLTQLLAPHGYQVTGLPVHGCLHLKSAVTAVDDETLLVNPRCLDTAPLRGFRQIEVDPNEPAGANALLIDDAVIYPASAPQTRERLLAHGIAIETVEVSELAKAEAGVTCSSLIFFVRRWT